MSDVNNTMTIDDSNMSEWQKKCYTEEQIENLRFHKEFYNKDSSVYPKTYRGSRYLPSRLLDESILLQDIIHNDKEDEKPHFCINNPNRLTTLIREHEKNLCFMPEGLIRTYPKDNFLKTYRDICQKLLKKELVELDMAEVKYHYDGDIKVLDWYVVSEGEENDEIPTMIEVAFPCYSDDDYSSIMKKIIDTVFSSGYTYSSSFKDEQIRQPFEGKEIILVKITFESKYSEYKFEFKEILYHVAPVENLQKISKFGLNPRSKSSRFKYPERVYLFNNAESPIIEYYGVEMIRDRQGKDSFSILKIRSEKLKNSPLYKNGKMNFYVDGKYPNIENSDPMAIFTYGNIPRDLIEDEIEICEVDVERGIVKNKTKMKLN